MAASPQRAYRAACPNCGAPVGFASAASSSAVCSFCRSTLLRDGESLRRIGVSAELFDDHSPLQLGTSGQHLGVAFTLVGRLQYGYEGGTWNEWHALFDGADGGPRSGWLSEDNGAFVIAFDAPAPADAPDVAVLRAGRRTVADGRAWDVASVLRAKLLAAQGELPTPPALEREFTVVDLRNAQGEVATLDDMAATPRHWSVGRAVALSTLALQGLREVGEKSLAARAIECPGCGAALAPTLASTKSIACTQCKAVVDISQGVGGELAHYAQKNAGEGGLAPQLVLGTVGTLALGGAALPWQVVGYMERCELPEPGDEEEEHTYWREYLLYNVNEGFTFLVDAEDGWSWARPLTGAPQLKGSQATWHGAAYLERYRYVAKVTWVLGEFYWRVQRDERAMVQDFHGTGAAARRRMSREQTAGEVTWSEGEMLLSDVVAKGFGLTGDAAAALQRDVAPVASMVTRGSGSWRVLLLVVLVFVVVAFVLSTCSSGSRCDDARASFGPDSAEYRQSINSNRSTRTSGGSYGGYSSGGGHK